MSTIEKLREVKNHLKSWNYTDFGDIDSTIKKLQEEIQEYDDLSNQRDLDTLQLKNRLKVQSDIWLWIKTKKIVLGTKFKNHMAQRGWA